MRNAARSFVSVCAIAVAASLASACSFAPRHTVPSLPTAPTYPEDYAGDRSTGKKATQLAWNDFFADPRLEALVKRALANNRNLEFAVAQVEEARARYRIQRAEQLPTIGVSGDASRNRAGPNALAIGGSPVPAGSALTYERYSVGVAIASFELDFWGRVRNLANVARAEYLATLEATRAFQLSLIREVANAYFISLEARERLELAEATVQSRREGLRIAKRRLDAGVTSALDYSQAETLLTQAEIELAALRLSQAQSDNLLTSLVGAPINDDLPEPIPLADQARLETLAAGLPSELLVSRPDILAAEERLRSARANIGAARAAFLPSMSLTGSYGYASNELDDLFDEGGLTWSYGPTITLPIFDFGRRRANLDIAKAREIQAIADYERTIQESFREVSDALAGRKFLAEQVEAQQRATYAQRRLAELARTRYREGVARYLEVLDAERSLFAAEQALLQVRRAQVSNLVSLYVALGGGL